MAAFFTVDFLWPDALVGFLLLLTGASEPILFVVVAFFGEVEGCGAYLFWSIE